MTDDKQPTRRGFLAAATGFVTGGLTGAGLGRMSVEGERQMAAPVAKPTPRRRLTESEREALEQQWMWEPVRYDGSHVAADQGKPPEPNEPEPSKSMTAKEYSTVGKAAGAGATTGTLVALSGPIIRAADKLASDHDL